MPLSCRFYSQKYPEVEDVVMVKVRSIAEMGAYVSLLEYNNIEGMILLSELSRRRIRSINKLIRVGRDECVVVIRVDKEKGNLFCFLVLFSYLHFRLCSYFYVILIFVQLLSICQVGLIFRMWVCAKLCINKSDVVNYLVVISNIEIV